MGAKISSSSVALWLALVSFLLIGGGSPSTNVAAFQVLPASWHMHSSRLVKPLFMSSPEEPPKNENSPVTENPASTAIESTSSKEEEEESASYPINVPSPILLASSMVIAIASTGTFRILAKNSRLEKPKRSRLTSVHCFVLFFSHQGPSLNCLAAHLNLALLPRPPLWHWGSPLLYFCFMHLSVKQLPRQKRTTNDSFRANKINQTT